MAKPLLQVNSIATLSVDEYKQVCNNCRFDMFFVSTTSWRCAKCGGHIITPATKDELGPKILDWPIELVGYEDIPIKIYKVTSAAGFWAEAERNGITLRRFGTTLNNAEREINILLELKGRD